MARNPKTWSGATPWTASGKNDKSGGEHWDKPTKNGERPHTVAATSMDHYKAVPFSSEGHPGLGNKSRPVGNPYAMSSDRSEIPVVAKAGKVNKSKPHPPAAPTSWKNKNYHMGVPATDAEGAAIAKKMKAH